MGNLYDIQINSLQGKPINFGDFKGKHILFVNVASKCGFTPQYKDLEKLYQEYQDDLMVIGVPCNQFGNQEPGSSDEIQEFCQVNYGVSFLITEKVDVKGSNQHPLYAWLTKKENTASATIVALIDVVPDPDKSPLNVIVSLAVVSVQGTLTYAFSDESSTG